MDGMNAWSLFVIFYITFFAIQYLLKFVRHPYQFYIRLITGLGLLLVVWLLKVNGMLPVKFLMTVVVLRTLNIYYSQQKLAHKSADA